MMIKRKMKEQKEKTRRKGGEVGGGRAELTNVRVKVAGARGIEPPTRAYKSVFDTLRLPAPFFYLTFESIYLKSH